METIQLLKYFKRELSQKEEAEVSHYLADDPDGLHYNAYRKARIIFETLAIHGGNKPAKRVIPKRKVWRNAIVMTAAAALAFIICIQVSRNSIYKELSSSYETLCIPHEQDMRLTLADGTKIWLGSGTEISVPQIFSKNKRDMKIIKGEVYLEVAKDAERPFVVETSVGNIEVLGTRFNVVVDTTNSYFATTLFEGKVQVSGKSSSSLQYTLKPMEEIKLNNGVWSVAKISSSYATPLWIEGVIDIANIPFNELMYRLERVYGVKVMNERTDEPQINYTKGKIRIKDGIEHTMDMLKLSSDFSYEYDKRNNVLFIR